MLSVVGRRAMRTASLRTLFSAPAVAVQHRATGVRTFAKASPYDSLPSVERVFKPLQERLGNFGHVYSNSTRLAAQSQDCVSKWVEVATEDMSKVPEILQKTLADPLEMGGHYLMLRQPVFDLISSLEEIQHGAEDNAGGSTVGIYGQRGAGKTTDLNLLALYAIQNDWLLLSTNGEEFPLDLEGFITPSTTRDGIFLQGAYTKAYMKKLCASDEHKLKQITLKRSYSYTWLDKDEHQADILVEETTKKLVPAPETLYDFMQQITLNENAIAGEMMYDFVEEIKQATEVKVMVLMDNANVWDQHSKFRLPSNPFKTIPNKQLSMVNAFSSFMTKGPVSGMSVFALTSHATMNYAKTHLQNATYTIKQDIYNDTEISNTTSHYKLSNLIHAEVDNFLLGRIKGLTGGVPKDMFFDAAMI